MSTEDFGLVNVFMSADDQLIRKLLKLGEHVLCHRVVTTVSHQLGAQGSTVRSPSSSTVKWLRPSPAAGPFADGYYVQGIKPSKWSG